MVLPLSQIKIPWFHFLMSHFKSLFEKSMYFNNVLSKFTLYYIKLSHFFFDPQKKILCQIQIYLPPVSLVKFLLLLNRVETSANECVYIYIYIYYGCVCREFRTPEQTPVFCWVNSKCPLWHQFFVKNKIKIKKLKFIQKVWRWRRYQERRVFHKRVAVACIGRCYWLKPNTG